uniref:Dolichyl-diphosphooligosaccharide-protein glycosyltransferase subunit TMEM258 n=1 Tax=Sus scrofa TaxID=9823 RepID=A0A8D1TAT7_PIG
MPLDLDSQIELAPASGSQGCSYKGRFSVGPANLSLGRGCLRKKSEKEYIYIYISDYPMPGKMKLEAMNRYISPGKLAVYPHLTVVLLAIGMFFTAWFFLWEVTSKYMRDIYKELPISSMASLFMAFSLLPTVLGQHLYISSQGFHPRGFMESLTIIIIVIIFYGHTCGIWKFSA